MIGQIVGGAMMVAGAIGAASQKTPKYNSSALDEAGALIEKQYGAINDYFSQANTAFEGQYQTFYGQSMQNAVNALAGSGIYESPVSQNKLNRTQTALGEQYATGKSQLAGQKMQAIGSVDQQKIAYLQNLAGLQYQQAQAKAQKQASLFSSLGGVGGALMGSPI